jgi:hypothetical protein
MFLHDLRNLVSYCVHIYKEAYRRFFQEDSENILKTWNTESMYTNKPSEAHTYMGSTYVL